MCHFGWATVHKYVVKHFACFCESVLGVRLTFESTDLRVNQITLYNMGGPSKLKASKAKTEVCQRRYSPYDSHVNSYLNFQLASLPYQFHT